MIATALAVPATMLSTPASATPPGPILELFAGSGTFGPPVAGPALSSGMQYPSAVALDSAGNVYVADYDNSVVEKITRDGALTIVAGNGTSGPASPGPALSSPLASPAGVAVDSAGNLYVSDADNNQIYKVTSAGTLSVIAGTGSTGQPVPGPATSSRMDSPRGVAVDSAGNVYFTDAENDYVEKVTPAGQLSIYAGTGNGGSATPGPATSSDISHPVGIALDSAGNLYVTDTGNAQVHRVGTTGTLSTVAGDGTVGPLTEGAATMTSLGRPTGVVVDSAGNLFIADSDNDQVAKVTGSGELSVYAGSGLNGAPVPGPALSSPLATPYDVAVTHTGVLYVVDLDNSRVERILPAVTAPLAPTGLVVTPGSGSASLSFTPGDDGGSAITGHEVSIDGGTTWQPLVTSAGAGGTLVADLTGLTDGVTYPVQVRAVSAVGVGQATGSVPVTPGACSSYVCHVYADLLGRVPDPAGETGWNQALTAGVPHVSVADAITSGTEYRALRIRDAYADFLGRDAEPAGLAAWLTALDRGATLEQMQAGVGSSSEAYALSGTDPLWVADLYVGALGRTAGAGEVTAWTSELAGIGRGGVALAVLRSPERLTNVVDGSYTDLLGRPADPAGRDLWVRAIQAGVRQEHVTAMFVSGPEYLAGI